MPSLRPFLRQEPPASFWVKDGAQVDLREVLAAQALQLVLHLPPSLVHALGRHGAVVVEDGRAANLESFSSDSK